MSFAVTDPGQVPGRADKETKPEGDSWPKPRTRTQASSSPVWHSVSYPASSSPQEMSEISSDRKSGYFPEFHGTEVWVPVPSSRSHLGPVLWTGLGPPEKPGVRGAKVDLAP